MASKLKMGKMMGLSASFKPGREGVMRASAIELQHLPATNERPSKNNGAIDEAPSYLHSGYLPSIPVAIFDLLLLSFIALFLACGFAYPEPGDGPAWLLDDDDMSFINFNTSLNFALGFIAWYFPPIFLLSAIYQARTLFDITSSIPGFGPLDFTTQSVIQCLIGFIISSISHRTVGPIIPFVTCKSFADFKFRIKNFIWSGNVRDRGKPFWLVSLFDVTLVLIYGLYIVFASQEMPDDVIGANSVVDDILVHVGCCGNLQLALGLPVFLCFFPLSLILAIVMHGTVYETSISSKLMLAIFANYVLTISIAYTAYRVKKPLPLKMENNFDEESSRSKLFKRRFRNLLWSRNGYRERAEQIYKMERLEAV